MTEKKCVLIFTENLYELVSSGIELSKAVHIIEDINGIPKKVRKTCAEIRAELDFGEKFSSALSSCTKISFGESYIAFVAAAEISGNLSETLGYLLRNIREQCESFEKFVVAAVYPFVVSLLAALVSFGAINLMQGILCSRQTSSQAFFAWILGGLFMIFCLCVFVFALRKIIEPDACAVFFKSIAFLAEHGIPLVAAIDCSLQLIEKKSALCSAVLEIKGGILNGEKVSDVFGTCLENAGFKYHSMILSSNLALAESSGNASAFSKTAASLEKRREKVRQVFFSLEQPLLMTVISVYLVIVLKNTVIPILTGFGGVL